MYHPFTLKPASRWIILGVLCFIFVACLDSTKSNEESEAPGRYAVISNLEKSAFVSLLSDLKSGKHDNSNGFEVGVFPYGYVYKDYVFVTQNMSSDEMLRFRRNSQGKLESAGKLNLGQGVFPADIAFVSDEKAYVSLNQAGKLTVFNPMTLAKIKDIDLSGSKYATGDNNPDPTTMLVHQGKLYVALLQSKDQVSAHNEVSMVVLDLAADTVMAFMRDTTRFSMPGRYGEQNALFADEAGDIYVYCLGGYGYAPGQKHGFLRIRKGEMKFDPDWSWDLSTANFQVKNSKIDHLNFLYHAGMGIVFGAANVPALASNPPDYVKDKTYQIMRFDLKSKTATIIPLPLGNGYSGDMLIDGDQLIVGIGATAGSGLYQYDLKSGKADEKPTLPTQGNVSVLLKFPE